MRTIRELRRASVMLGRPGLPGTGVTSGQLADITGKANRAETRQYDSRSWPTLNDAIDAVHALGGGELFVAEPPPAGADIVLKDKVYLTGRGIGATVMDVNTITGSGSLVDLPALSGNIAQHSRTITFAAAPDLAPGDVFILHNSNDSSFSTARTYYRAGEFCRVDSVSGATVTLTSPTYGAYTIGANITARKVVPIRTGISGMTIRGTTGQYLIRVDLGTDLVFRDLSLSGSDIAHIALSRCYNVDVGDVKAFDAQAATTPSGLNYGVMMLNCQRVRIRGVDLETRRHGLTMGGDNATAGVPNRDIIVSDSRISGLSTTAGVCGCNMHGNSEDIHFDTVSMPAGFNPAGDWVTVRNCDIASAAWGSVMSSMEMLGTNHTYEGNTFRLTRNYPNARGMAYMELGASCTRQRGLMRFIDNVFDCGPYGSDGSGPRALYILVNSDNVPTNNELEVSGNTFRTTQAVTNHYGVRVQTAVTSVGFSDIRMIENSGNMPVGTLGVTTMYFVGSGFGAPSFAAAKGSRYLQRDGGDGTTLYINVTGTTSWKAVG